jgi:pimeloyl-ACP methyl ester carboxylesterase
MTVGLQRHRLWVDSEGVRIAALRWGDATDKPPALLLHGTSFVAETWDEIAHGLAERYTVYALDRRGHGASDKPGRYHFVDFARDVCATIEALDLSGIYGIGHSAGATDLLLAAKLLPGRFTRLFVMEPTVMDPTAYPGDDARLSDQSTASVQGVLRRQSEFASAEAAFQRYRAAPAFAQWTDPALHAYVAHGFQQLPDGRVQLLCRPEVESAILLPIFEAMEQVYRGDHSGNPFGWLGEIDCPVRIATTETSWSVYQDMALRAARLMPGASQVTFDGVGHCVAQEAPALLLRALHAFATEAG